MDCVHLWAIVNNAAVNIDIHISLILILLDIYLEVGLLDLTIILFLILTGRFT